MKSNGTGPFIGIVASSGSQLTCSAASDPNFNVDEIAGFTGFVMELTNSAQTAPIAGTYTVSTSSNGPPLDAYVASAVENAQCSNAGGLGTAGTVTLSNVSATSVSGSFDVTISTVAGTPDHVTGTFDLPLCQIQVIPQADKDGGFFTCQ